MCPPHFFRIGNECYYISATKLNWLDAHFECKDRNSKLAEPMKYDDKYLRKYLTMSKQKNYIWIGGNYNWRTNKWQWGYNGKDIGYQSFSQMVPGSSQDLKYHCAVLNPDLKFRWSAKLCTDKLNFICQHKMPFVNSHSRAKVYNRWNATFPNELANEVEVVIADQPRVNKQKDYYSTVSNSTINQTALYNRIKNMKHSNRTTRIRPSRPRRPSYRKTQHKNDYIGNDVYRRPVVEYAPESISELTMSNGNGGYRNGNGAFPQGFNVDIHRPRTNHKSKGLNEVTGKYRPHQHRHHLSQQYLRPATAGTPTTQSTTQPSTTTTTTTTTTNAPITTTAPPTRPIDSPRTAAQLTHEEKKARRRRLQERIRKLSPEEQAVFFEERAKRKRMKQPRSKNETIP